MGCHDENVLREKDVRLSLEFATQEGASASVDAAFLFSSGALNITTHKDFDFAASDWHSYILGASLVPRS